MASQPNDARSTDQVTSTTACLKVVPRSVHKSFTQLICPGTITAIIGLFNIPILLVSMIKIGPSRYFFKRDQPKSRPAYLMDPSLGEHKSIALKVRQTFCVSLAC